MYGIKKGENIDISSLQISESKYQENKKSTTFLC